MTAEEKVRATTRALLSAGDRETDARLARDAAVRAALAEGLTLRHVAALAGISHQRVAKIAQG